MLIMNKFVHENQDLAKGRIYATNFRYNEAVFSSESEVYKGMLEFGFLLT